VQAMTIICFLMSSCTVSSVLSSAVHVGRKLRHGGLRHVMSHTLPRVVPGFVTNSVERVLPGVAANFVLRFDVVTNYVSSHCHKLCFRLVHKRCFQTLPQTILLRLCHSSYFQNSPQTLSNVWFQTVSRTVSCVLDVVTNYVRLFQIVLQTFFRHGH